MMEQKLKKMPDLKFQERGMSFKKTHVIINPASAGGKTRIRQTQIINELDKHFGNRYSIFITQRPLDATFSVRRAIIEGSELIIAIGGDGTIQETVNGFFFDGYLINPACQLGIINSGTGHGFAQSLGLPSEIKKQLEVICRGESRFIDVGRVVFSNKDGIAIERFFINECQAGIGGEVVKCVQSKHKKFGGLIVFGLTAFSKVFSYPGHLIAATIDNSFHTMQKLIGIAIANGKFTGGGMNLAPQAKADDGLLDILLIHEQPILQRLWNFPKIYSGQHILSSKFSYFQGKSITLNASERVFVEADGELLGFLPCTVEVIPSALKVRVYSQEKG
ncbi:MAG: diacylglycerol kinase family protein [Acidobacteriota bacterium]